MRRLFCYFNVVILLFFLSFSKVSNSQNDSISGIKYIQKLIENDSLQKADLKINTQINTLISQKQYDSLSEYIYLIGKIYLLKNEVDSSKIESKKIVSLIIKNTTNSNTLYKANINLSKLFFELNSVQEAYNYALIAKKYASNLSNNENLLNSEYYLGDYGMKLGNIDLLEKHIRNAKYIIKTSPNKQYKIAARVFNLMGAVMYFSSKQDSAIYYFEAALKNIQFLEKNYENQLYLPAAIKGNLFLMYLNQGKHTEAKKFVEESISMNKMFLQKTKNHPLSNRVKRNIGIGYTNLSSLYNDLGDYNKCDQITQLSYNYTKRQFSKNTQEYFMAALNVAEIKNSKREFEDALKYLNKAKNSLNSMEDENPQLNAFLYNVFASLEYKTQNPKKAIDYWLLSNSYYEKTNLEYMAQIDYIVL